MDFRNVLKKSRETWFGKVAQLFDRQSIGDEVWDELEELLIGADVGVPTAEKLIQAVKARTSAEKLNTGEQVKAALKQEMVKILICGAGNVEIKANPPRVTLVVGVNGSGKTTSIAKLANLYKKQGKSVLLGAADTFRAAASDQLKVWGDRIGIDVVAHQPGADPGAVVYDTLQAGQSRHIDEVIIDTAGRLQTKFNLMDELKKIKKVAGKLDPTAPHEVILVLDATTGQNGLSQARNFTSTAAVTDLFLAKLDGTAKGGVVLAICDELKIPIRFIGTGEKLDDISPFNPEAFVDGLFNS